MNFVQVRLAGGLGNQMFEYSFARAYAEKHGFELRCLTGILHKFFVLPPNAPADQDLPERPNTECEKWDGESSVTIIGMGQMQKNLDYYSKAKVREWFTLRPEYAELVKDVPAMELVANVREGDYTYSCNPLVLIDRNSFLDACDQYGLDKSKLYFLDGETHYRIPQIEVGKPWNELDDYEKGKLEGDKCRLDWLPDWAVLLRAKVLLRPNSTFSWWGAELGTHERVFCPDLSGVDPDAGIAGLLRKPQKVPFVEGNHTPMARGYWFCTELRLKET
jgi:hypothetical protein